MDKDKRLVLKTTRLKPQQLESLNELTKKYSLQDFSHSIRTIVEMFCLPANLRNLQTTMTKSKFINDIDNDIVNLNKEIEALENVKLYLHEMPEPTGATNG